MGSDGKRNEAQGKMVKYVEADMNEYDRLRIKIKLRVKCNASGYRLT